MIPIPSSAFPWDPKNGKGGIWSPSPILNRWTASGGSSFLDFFLDGKNPGGPFTFEVGVGNLVDAPLEAAWTEWVVEPVAGVYSPDPGDTWRANFRRNEISKISSADWQYPIDYGSNLFGRLMLAD